MLSAAMHFHRRRRTEISIFRFLMIALSSCEDMLHVASIAFRQLTRSHENDTFRVCDKQKFLHSLHFCAVSAKPLPTHKHILLQIMVVNPKRPNVLLVGHRQTVHTQIRRHKKRRLIRVSTVCLHNALLRFEYKKENFNPLNENGLVQLIGVGNSIRLKWVKKNHVTRYATVLRATVVMHITALEMGH